MKKLFSTIITLIGALCAYGQDTDSLQKVIVEPLTEIQHDSLLTNLEKRVHQIADEVLWIRCFARYKVYRTFNIYTSLKLDTATGRITALQIGINDKAARMNIPFVMLLFQVVKSMADLNCIRQGMTITLSLWII